MSHGSTKYSPSHLNVALAFLFILSLVAAGCGGGGGSGGGGAVVREGFSGRVNGGGPQTPIKQSAVTLYVMGTSYGGTATVATSATSSDGGGFSFTPGYTCPAGRQTYITVTGGDAGGGTNSAIGMIALTGLCDSLSSSTFVTINELTTVAAAWALAQFTDATGVNLGAPSSNSTGLNNAVNQAATNLVVSSLSTGGNPGNTGIPAAFWANSGATDTNCTGGSPVTNCDGLKRINTLANILSACINSSGATSTQCQQLFCGATPGATWNGTSCSTTPTPTDTLRAAHAIVTNPQSNLSTIYGVSPPPGVTQFTPTLSSAPDGWELALNFADAAASFNQPKGIAVDGSGNVWVANYVGGTVTKLDPNGAILGNFNGNGNLNNPTYVAIDSSGNAWLTNLGGNTVSKLQSDGTYVNSYGTSVNQPQALALDSSGNVWITNSGAGNWSVTELSSNGSFIGNFAPSGSNFSFPIGISISAGTGSVWVANNVGNTVTKLASSGASANNYNPSGANFSGPQDLRLDNSENVWVTNSGNNSVTKLNSDGSLGGNFTPSGLNSPNGLAIDSGGNLWVTNYNGNSLSELTSTGAAAGNFAPDGAGFFNPYYVAIDSSGNVWLANQGGFGGGSSVAEFVGAAGPVLTPIQQCLISGSNVCLP